MLELPRGRDLEPSNRKIISPKDITRVREGLAGQTTVVAGGVFDLLHGGHIAFLEEAKAQADVLFACISSDETVRERKGNNRPVQNQYERARIVASLGCVDYVVPMPYAEGAVILGMINPTLWARGLDSKGRGIDQYYQQVITAQQIPIVYLGGATSHSSELIEKIREGL